jgi:hypothetical protein
MIYGSMITAAAGWGGLLLTLEAARGATLSPRRMFLAGVLLGLAFYLFPSALFYLALALLLLVLMRHLLLFQELPALAAGGGGYLIGALPLLLARSAYGGGLAQTGNFFPHVEVSQYLQRLAGFFLRPPLFRHGPLEFSATLPIRSWTAFGGTALLPRSPWWGQSAIQDGGSGEGICPWRPTEKAGHGSGSAASLFASYSLEPRAGRRHYVIPVFPVFRLLAAWGLLLLFRWRKPIGWCALLLAALIEVPLLVDFARRDTATDWGMTVHGADVHALERFLREHDYRYVIAPYGIKWRLMFLSGESVKAAAHLFCFDRETDDNNEVVTRVNSGQVPLVIVLDQAFHWLTLARQHCPEGWFTIEDFLTSVGRAGVSFEREPIGDFVVFHRFSAPVRLPPLGETDTTGRAIRVFGPGAPGHAPARDGSAVPRD